MSPAQTRTALAWALGACGSALLALGALAGSAARVAPRCARTIDAAPRSERVRGRLVVARSPGELIVAERVAGRRCAAAPSTRALDACSSRAEPRAALVGRITRDGCGVSARIRFELGWNRGMIVDTAGDGAFACRSLAPGFQEVTVAIEGQPPCTRSLFLEPYREATLRLDFGAPSARRVRVLDPEDSPLLGAEVQLDGEPALTDASGRAQLCSTCSGAPELVVRAPNCAWFACALGRSAPEPDAEAEFVVRLERACVLELALPALTGQDEAVVYLLPQGPGRLAGRPLRPATPWHLASPLRLAPGASVRLENLPAGELEIRAFHPGVHLGIERVVLDPEHPLALTLRAKASGSEDEAHPASLVDLLSSAGLGELPRLQPLDLLPTGCRSTPLGHMRPADAGADQ